MSTTAGSHTSKIPGNSRNANNSVILNTERSQPQQGDMQLQGIQGSLTFSSEYLPPVFLIGMTPVVNLELRISPQIFQITLMALSGAWG
jgi:hypothetical protein